MPTGAVWTLMLDLEPMLCLRHYTDLNSLLHRSMQGDCTQLRDPCQTAQHYRSPRIRKGQCRPCTRCRCPLSCFSYANIHVLQGGQTGCSQRPSHDTGCRSSQLVCCRRKARRPCQKESRVRLRCHLRLCTVGLIPASVNFAAQALMAEISPWMCGLPVRKLAPSQTMELEVWLTIIAPTAAKE